MNIQLQCPTHSQSIQYCCTQRKCSQRYFCQMCEHNHEKIPIETLFQQESFIQTLQLVQKFKNIINECLNTMETELNKAIQKLSITQIPNSLQQLMKLIEDQINAKTYVEEFIQGKLELIINALKQQTSNNTSQIIVERKKTIIQQSLIQNEAQQQQEFIKRQRQSKIFNSGTIIMQPTSQQLNQNPQIQQYVQKTEDGKLIIPRLMELSKQDWDYKLDSSTLFCCIFTALKDIKLIGFLQPSIFKNENKNFQKKTCNINVGVYNKKNLIKSPLILEKVHLRHSKMKIINDCYEIKFTKPIQLSELSEYSLVIWPNKSLHCHYFSIAAPANKYIAFQIQDFNDSTKIKRNEEFPQVISTYRAGLVPYLIIEPCDD